MTRAEFIAQYVSASNADGSGIVATKDGFRCPGSPETASVALPCDCGEDDCHGWAMVTNYTDAVEWHLSRLPRRLQRIAAKLDRTPSVSRDFASEGRET